MEAERLQDERDLQQIQADVLLIRKDARIKISDVSLQYLKRKKIIQSIDINLYAMVNPDPDERTII
ncbi:hypothetical protein [Methanosarcina sp. Kolksee]|uniref:hypothetical protein n=1 Tax=Methanosarcina sp. Kolksee TaxID=1434099 RepID=UPI0012E028FC|nr:hypothetical protein [Methanosarcina sp. Kolksee]